MKPSSIERPRTSGTVSVKLDASERGRIAALASLKRRTSHYLMREAILDYVSREESRLNFIAAAESSFEHYKQTGLHVTFDEVSTWVDAVQENADTPIPPCHT